MTLVTFRGESYDITRDQCLDVLSRSIDLEIGQDASALLFKTSKLVYGVDYQADLPEKLDSFEEFLMKTLGGATCDRILNNALLELEDYNIDKRNRKAKRGGKVRDQPS